MILNWSFHNFQSYSTLSEQVRHLKPSKKQENPKKQKIGVGQHLGIYLGKLRAQVYSQNFIKKENMPSVHSHQIKVPRETKFYMKSSAISSRRSVDAVFLKYGEIGF